MADIATKTQTRRLLITLAQKRQRRGNGSDSAFLKERTTRMLFPNPASLLAPLPWAVIGAAATRLYMPERATNDLDILIRSQDAEVARANLSQAGAAYQSELTIGESSWILANDFPLDMIECQEAWAETALEQAQVNRDRQGMPIVPLPYLVLMKFQTSRVQDLADITRMLGQAVAEQLDATRAMFRQWIPDEIDDLESLILLGQLEMN